MASRKSIPNDTGRRRCSHDENESQPSC